MQQVTDLPESQIKVRTIHEDVATDGSVSTAAPSAVYMRIGGQDIEAHYEPRCDSCHYFKRGDMERLLVMGIPPHKIEERLPHIEDENDSYYHRPSHWSMRRHRKLHMGLDQYTKALVSESLAAEAGLDPSKAGEFMLDRIGALKTMRSLGMMKIAEGKIQVNEVSELLAVMKLEAELERATRNEQDAGEAQGILSAYAQEVARLLNPEQREQLNSYLMVNPAIRNAMGMGASSIDAESWEDEELIDVTEQEGGDALVLTP